MHFDEKLLKEKYFSAALEQIKAIVAIPSYAQPPTKNAPYGIGVDDVLTFALNLGQELGFKTYRDPKGKYGYCEYGSGKEIFAILGHLDVVPPGDLKEWKVPPFNPEVINDILYGRGVLDDKGPMIIIMYCLKYLQDHNFQPQRRIRIIFGLTEETTWDSINTYMRQEGTPTFGFTPDGMFPLVYAEKGILDFDIVGKGDKKFNVTGGVAYNVTCPTAQVQGVDAATFMKLAQTHQYRCDQQEQIVTIHGRAAHGSRPEDGINAGLRTLLVLNEMAVKHPLVQFVGEVLQEDTTLRTFFHDLDDESGQFTINVGLTTINKEKSLLGCNVRFPVTAHRAEIIKRLTKIVAPYGLTIKEQHYDKPLYMSQDSPIVTTLMQVYREVSGNKKAQPIAIGGGTYARAMPNCVAFGAIFDVNNSTEHQYNECIKVNDLWKAMQIYARAIVKLGDLPQY